MTDSSNSLPINNIFYSIQGEGFLAGVPSAFIRLAGCHLRCRWCDTAYAWETAQSTAMTISEVLAKIQMYNTSKVVVTGGEPLIQPDLEALLDELAANGYHITLETTACEYRQVKCDLVSISPKMSNSIPAAGSERFAHHSEKRLNVPAIYRYIENYNYQLKFVIEAPEDIIEIKELLRELPAVDAERVMLMPQSGSNQQHIERAKAVVKLCLENNFRYCPRLHIQIWSQRRGH